MPARTAGAKCDLRHTVRFPTILMVIFVVTLRYNYRITKGKTMCSICAGKSKVVIDSLCDNHYFEWVNEKICNDLDTREDYFHLV